ncbi:hypothetical protein ACFOOM_01250 [Streptomyces echinoruber]|uniref:Uncharacterized protein n=1 Tax=Streptomyces echinoruber TaxID=68898 RepID=A0A918QVN6_9ACTN|nr:hypothetical protein [Streptomyces echinoruber]GGZ72875.1 hypothetical protein GCM10010389_07810 [Streptomyces echinoruber]
MTATVAEVTDQEIARRLTSAEVSNLSVARALGVPWGRVDEVRRRLGLATYRRGRRVPETTWQEAVRRRVREVPGGHADWTGSYHPNGTPILSWRGRAQTAYQAVFRLHYRRPPQDNISHSPECDRERCVAGEHLEDRVLREQRRSREAGGVR